MIIVVILFFQIKLFDSMAITTSPCAQNPELVFDFLLQYCVLIFPSLLLAGTHSNSSLCGALHNS